MKRFWGKYYQYPRLREFTFQLWPLSMWKLKTMHTILKNVPTKGQIQILEVGCGTGMLTRKLHLKLPEALITAIEISPENFGIASKKKLHRVKFVLEDFFKIIGKFDLIVAMNVFQHFELEKGFLKLKSLMHKGSVALVSLNEGRILTKLHHFFYKLASGEQYNLYPLERSVSVARKIGFKTEVEHIDNLEGSYLLKLRF